MNISDSLSRMQFLSVTATLTAAVGIWETQATHEIATVTGTVRLIILPRITTAVVGVGLSAQLGVAGTTDAFIASTGVAALVINTVWLDATPAAFDDTTDLLDKIVTAGVDVGYELTGAPATAGVIEFLMFWEALAAGSSVTAGAGGAL